MSWVTVIWAMVASACLTLAGMHFLVWCRQRDAWGNLFFSLLATGTALFAACEFWMMRSHTPEEYTAAVRWIHVPVWVMIVSLVCFIRFYLRAGRPWLAWTACGLRTLSLLINFLSEHNLNYTKINALRNVSFLGEPVTIVKGVPNPWMLVGQASLLLLVIFVADAVVTAWRRGDRRKALVTGGSIVFWVLIGAIQAVLVVWANVGWPFAASVFFMFTLGAMSYEMSLDLINAAQLSDELHESEERLTLAAEAAGFGVWMWLVDGNQIIASKRWLQMFGFETRAKADLPAFLQRIHPDDRERVEHGFRRAAAESIDYVVEYRVVLPDGSRRWISARGRMHPAAHGKPARLLGASIDISQRKQAEDELRLVVEASPSGILLANSEGRMVLVNAATERLFGYTRHELIGQVVELLIPERFRDVHPGHRAGFFAAPHARSMGAGRELFARRKDGSEFPVEIGLSPIQSAERTLILTVIVDITARKQAEAEAQKQRAELTHFARVSTMGALASSLAHELNQPLSAILSNAQAASRFLTAAPPDLSEVRGALEDIAQDTRRAGEVIRQMRSLVRKDEPNLKPLELNQVISDVVRLLHSDMLLRKVRVALELGPAPGRVNGDGVQLQQVILNLVLNAFDAMKETEESRRVVVVRTRRLETGLVQIEVSDCGMGISPERHDRLFEPFRSSKPDGLGLGLSISHSIVSAHHGRIWGENNAGPGATFYVTLPLDPAARAQN